MNTVTKQAIVPYSATQMYDLVNDVAAYPGFIPGCTAIEIHEQSVSAMEVSMTVEKMGFTMTMRTRNTLQVDESIKMALQSGPLKRLVGSWHFSALGEEASKIVFHLEFEMAGGMLKRAMEQYLKGLADTMLVAFERRARDVYGE